MVISHMCSLTTTTTRVQSPILPLAGRRFNVGLTPHAGAQRPTYEGLNSLRSP